ncbi:hypothetical protein AAY473_037144 [Plecturocebus cupreus]
MQRPLTLRALAGSCNPELLLLGHLGAPSGPTVLPLKFTPSMDDTTIYPVAQVECSGTVTAHCNLDLLSSSSQSSHLSLLSSWDYSLLSNWDYRYAPPRTANIFCAFTIDGVLVRLVSNSYLNLVNIEASVLPYEAQVNIVLTGRFLAKEPYGSPPRLFWLAQLFCRGPARRFPVRSIWTDGLGWSHPHKENSNWKR